ncbi:MAG: Zn-ribbon domain-containing OB-fold protein [Desulfurella sp.]|uniref:Zn-ribbon domain-containing OB-fold protein n=1 Tax=Desulfurella sp. TaxID=1962857 RepID=UPI003D0D3F55
MNTFLPTPTADTKFFWEATQNKELKFQKCRNCGHVRWPASIACPECHSFDFEYVISKGIGKIYSFVVYNVAFHEAFKQNLPYVVAIIELEEGPHILSNVITNNPAELRCEMPVEVIWEEYENYNIPKFKPFES